MIPLAERIRPGNLDELAGQQHLTGKGSILRTALEHGRIPSMILWGPPGTGKTTIANIIANTLNVPFFTLSAISAGVKDVREVIEQAKTKSNCILFIDEIHRFNKGQQDALLGAVEKGIITLIGATTENPSFEVNSALLSRCQVYILKALDEKDLVHLLHTAIVKDEILKKKKIELKETAALINISGGDARKLLNLLELVADTAPAPSKPSPSGGGFANTQSQLIEDSHNSENFPIKKVSPKSEDSAPVAFPKGEGRDGAGSDILVITDDLVMNIAQKKIALYDKSGEQHYDIISAFIKSIRG